MLDNKIGYIICESGIDEPVKPKTISESDNLVTIETVLQRMDNKNRNGRYYAKEDLEPAIRSARIKELIEKRSWFGESSHPVTDTSLSRQQTILLENISHEILKIWTEGDLVKGIVKATPTPRGRDFHNLIMGGMQAAFSLRALGSITNTKRGAEVKNINIITYDNVVFPSHPESYQNRIVSESVGLEENKKIWVPSQKPVFEPITNQQVMSYIKNESANLNTILKSFDTLYESATLIDNGSRVQLSTSTGDILVINLESYIQNEIMDFCSK